MSQTAVSKMALHGRVIQCDSTGDKDVTQRSGLGFTSLAEAGADAANVLENFRNQLGLLQAAARGSDPLEAKLVRGVVDDLLMELDDEMSLPWFVERAEELFTNAEPLPPLVTHCPGDLPSLQLVTHGKASQKDAEIENVAG